jgi:hypothetical protein
VKFSVLSDATGTIHFSDSNVVTGGNADSDLDGLNSRFAVINGIQIGDVAAVVPEPSAASLGGFGLLLALRRRR